MKETAKTPRFALKWTKKHPLAFRQFSTHGYADPTAEDGEEHPPARQEAGAEKRCSRFSGASVRNHREGNQLGAARNFCSRKTGSKIGGIVKKKNTVGNSDGVVYKIPCGTCKKM